VRGDQKTPRFRAENPSSEGEKNFIDHSNSSAFLVHEQELIASTLVVNAAFRFTSLTTLMDTKYAFSTQNLKTTAIGELVGKGYLTRISLGQYYLWH
jgi:hypothetical protein